MNPFKDKMKTYHKDLHSPRKPKNQVKKKNKPKHYDLSKIKKYSNVRVNIEIENELKAFKSITHSNSQAKLIKDLMNHAKSSILNTPDKKLKFKRNLNLINKKTIDDAKLHNKLK